MTSKAQLRSLLAPFLGGVSRRPLAQVAEQQELPRLQYLHHEAIGQALQPFLKAVEDLSQDWATRKPSFWQQLISALHPLRGALRERLAFLEISPTDVDAQTDELLCLYYADSQVDTVGISLTAYLPVCESPLRRHLQQRYAALADVRELAKRTQQVLVAIRQQTQEPEAEEVGIHG